MIWPPGTMHLIEATEVMIKNYTDLSYFNRMCETIFIMKIILKKNI